MLAFVHACTASSIGEALKDDELTLAVMPRLVSAPQAASLGGQK